jgi:hypothetical protein
MRTFAPALIIIVATVVAGGSQDGAIRPIAGGTFEASGAVGVANGVLFVDDGRPEELLWMALDDTGRQRSNVERVALGAAIPDMEGITTDGQYIYVVGSQSKKNAERAVGLARFTFDPKTKTVADMQTIPNLKGLIFDALPDVARAAGQKPGGLDIEGLAWDPAGRRLLLGLRSPAPNGNAVIIPATLKNPDGAFARENLSIAAGPVIRLPLAGAIRSLEFDAKAGEFTIISDGSTNGGSGFSYWRWSGRGVPSRLSVASPITDSTLKPEGIARVGVGPASYTLIVFDTSRYATISN